VTLRIAVASAEGQLVDHEIQGNSFVVGRSLRADLTIPDRSISREHARFFRQGDGWFVEDLGSHNGTRVNEAAIMGPARVRDGDRVTAGDCVLLVRLGDQAEPELTVAGDAVYRSARELLGPPVDTSPISTPPTEVSRRLLDRLKLLNEVNHALARSISLEELLELILDRTSEHFRPQEAAIFLRDASGNDVCAARRCAPGRTARPLHSRSLLHEVIDKGMAARVVDASKDERFAGAESLLNSGMRTLIAAPLLDPQGALGMIVLGATVEAQAYGEADLELLVSLASVAALRIRNVRLVAEALERQRLEQELRLARAIQVAILPSSLPVLPGYEIHAGNVPSRGVSGDFYKVSLRAEGRECVIFQTDVSGKGVSAALLTASLEALLAVPLETAQDPHLVFDLVSPLLFQRTPIEKFATAFLGVLDLETGQLRYVNAGHSAALLLHTDGEAEWLKSNGFPIGLRQNARYSTVETWLKDGDLLVIYTDGITEATNPDEEEFGLPRLLEASRTHRDKAPREFALALEREVDLFVRGEPYADDRTLVVVRRLG
jgi:serine phosphatase RsbU (regulator of sigma subunit)